VCGHTWQESDVLWKRGRFERRGMEARGGILSDSGCVSCNTATTATHHHQPTGHASPDQGRGRGGVSLPKMCDHDSKRGDKAQRISCSCDGVGGQAAWQLQAIDMKETKHIGGRAQRGGVTRYPRSTTPSTLLLARCPRGQGFGLIVSG
jgi:hypothetical protein